MGARPSKPLKVLTNGDPALLYLENIEAAQVFEADLSRIPRNELRTRARRVVAAPA
jgi:hypothetical protein